jgi:hypothetical protein
MTARSEGEMEAIAQRASMDSNMGKPQLRVLIGRPIGCLIRKDFQRVGGAICKKLLNMGGISKYNVSIFHSMSRGCVPDLIAI